MSERMLSSSSSNLSIQSQHTHRTWDEAAYLKPRSLRERFESLSNLGNQISRREQYQRSQSSNDSIIQRLLSL